MIAAMNRAKYQTEVMLNDEVHSFYGQGNPIMYQRLGLLDSSPHVTGVSSGGNFVRFDAYMEPIDHPTGTFDGEEILFATESGTSGVLGRSGYWARSEAKFQQILDNAMSAYFS